MPVPRIEPLETSRSTPIACPACRGFVAESLLCEDCGRQFPRVAGMADLRLASDRYLPLDEERAKAERLAELAETLDFPGLARAYYAMTGDVDARRRDRYLAHVDNAETRGRALAALLPKPGRVLEVGCGTGGLMVAANGRGIKIQGIDIASRWLVLARKRLECRDFDVHFSVADAARLPYPNENFDAVVADSLIEHLPEPATAMSEWLRVTRPGGRLILWSPNRFSLLTDPHVGLWGLGFLPRPIQEKYVRFRRECGWPIRLFSAKAARRMAEKAGWKRVQIGAAPGFEPRRSHRIYNQARSLLIGRSLARRFGPVWQLMAWKEVRQ